jgi:DNA-binding transcriptional MerR regulator/uncharacterized protein (DUF433 family)
MLTDTTNHSHVGVGLYSLADAARLAGTHPETVRRWVSETAGIVPRQLPRAEKLLTFQELMEIHFIQMFRAEGVSFQTIRRASEAAASQFGAQYPFTVKRFDTDGRTVFATLIKDNPKDVLVEDLQRGQYVFQSIVRPFFRKLEYRGADETVSRFWPRAKQGRVVLDPLRKFGKPIDAETGISTSAIFEAVMAGGGQNPAVVARWLNIPSAAVKAAVDFERSLA